MPPVSKFLGCGYERLIVKTTKRKASNLLKKARGLGLTCTEVEPLNEYWALKVYATPNEWLKLTGVCK